MNKAISLELENGKRYNYAPYKSVWEVLCGDESLVMVANKEQASMLAGMLNEQLDREAALQARIAELSASLAISHSVASEHIARRKAKSAGLDYIDARAYIKAAVAKSHPLLVEKDQ